MLPHETPNASPRFLKWWSMVWCLLIGLLFVGVTGLTIGVFLSDPAYSETSPVTDIGFLVWGLLIACGLAAQLFQQRPVEGLQVALLTCIALVIAAGIGLRTEPFCGALLFGSVVAVAYIAHPQRSTAWRLQRAQPLLIAVWLVGIGSVVPYCVSLLRQALAAGPACFLGQCAKGDRFAELAAACIAVLLVTGLAIWQRPMSRFALWCASLGALAIAIAILLVPSSMGSPGVAWGVAGGVWGLGLLGLGERAIRRDRVSH